MKTPSRLPTERTSTSRPPSSGIEETAEIKAIAGDLRAPTFDNTIEALDNSGDLLEIVQMSSRICRRRDHRPVAGDF
jgi:hypothetical protein